MKTYNNSELTEMQQQAIARVQEMQRRSQQARDQASIDLGESEASGKNITQQKAKPQGNTEQREAQMPGSAQRKTLQVPDGNREEARQASAAIKQERPPLKIPDTPRRISMPIELPEKKTVAHEAAPASAQAQTSAPSSGIASLLGDLDADKGLILALVLLLSGEDADMELILALLYILY